MSDKDVNKNNGNGSSDPAGADVGRVDPEDERKRRALIAAEAADRRRQQQHYQVLPLLLLRWTESQ